MLNGDVERVTPIPDSPFFAVLYFGAPGELRRTDNEGQIVALSGDVVYRVIPIPGSPFFVVDYLDEPDELRRTDDEGQIVALSGGCILDVSDSQQTLLRRRLFRRAGRTAENGRRGANHSAKWDGSPSDSHT